MVMVLLMVLPFVLGFAAALLAYAGACRPAPATGLATVAVEVWWPFYHATDTLEVSL